MRRRQLLLAAAGVGAVIGIPQLRVVAKEIDADMKAIETIQSGWQELLPNGRSVPSVDDPVALSGEEWRGEVSSAAYQVLFEDGTERPFTSPLNDIKAPGVYVCAACELPLFTSEMKFDSGTGWPSFFTHIPGHLDTKVDYKLILPRTEYHCVRCGGHQGHVFKDGPAPTHERWCNNGVALTFLAK